MNTMQKSPFSCEGIGDIWKEDFDGTMWLHFMLEERHYEMRVRKKENKKKVELSIFHEQYSDQEKCPFCSRQNRSCDVLNQYKYEIFSFLKKQPAFRLRLLFDEEF